MVLFLCAFYMQMWVGELILVDVTVQPGWGFYGFLLATMISLGLSHLILACHRLIVEPKVLPIPDALDPRESLSNIVYEVEVEEELPVEEQNQEEQNSPVPNSAPATNEELVPLAAANDEPKTVSKTLLVKFTYFGKFAVGGVICLTAILVVLGTFLLTMGFEFKGLTGYMLKSDAKLDYSYVTIGTEIPEHSGLPDDFGVRWMQASYFLFGLAMPLGLLTVFMVLWTVPLTLARQRQLFVLSEVLNAWSALDVFCVAIAAGLLEIHQFAMFIVGDSCDQIDEVLSKYMDDKLDGDDTCFDVVAYLKPVSWLLSLATPLILFLISFLFSLLQRLRGLSS